MRIETHGGAGHARRPRRSKVYVKTIGDKTSMKIMVSFCPTFGGAICHNSEFRADDPRLQLGQVGGPEAAEAPGRLVSRVVPRDALRLPDPSVMLCFHFRGSLDAL